MFPTAKYLVRVLTICGIRNPLCDAYYIEYLLMWEYTLLRVLVWGFDIWDWEYWFESLLYGWIGLRLDNILRGSSLCVDVGLSLRYVGCWFESSLCNEVLVRIFAVLPVTTAVGSNIRYVYQLPLLVLVKPWKWVEKPRIG